MEKTQKEVWNILANKWNDYRRKITPEVEEFLGDKKGNILDLGCGSGRQFMKVEGRIYAVDFSKEMIKLAKLRAEELNLDVKLYCNGANDLEFEDDFFDSAIYISALHCVDDENKRKESLLELYRVLKPKSRALISVWSSNHGRIKRGRKEQYIPWTEKGIKYQRYYYIYDKSEIESLVKEVGFKVVKCFENENIVIEVEK